jgi:hypothetical protein
VSQARDLRNFDLSQGRAAQDYHLGVARDTQQYQLNQGRAAQDFTIQQQQAQEQRQLQLDDLAYQRKYQGIQLELQHNRNLEDSSIAFQRLNQAVGLQTERFSNQASDISVDQALQNRDYGINAYRTLRDYGYQQQDFAGEMRKSNPLGAYGQSLTDPVFADALARNATATGQLPLGQQISQAQSGLDWGDMLGQALAQSIPILAPLGLGSGAKNLLGGSTPGLNGLNSSGSIVPGVLPPGMSLGGFGGSGGSPNITFSPQHNVTFPSTGTGNQDDLYAQYMQELRNLDSKYASILNGQIGTNAIPYGW